MNKDYDLDNHRCLFAGTKEKMVGVVANEVRYEIRCIYCNECQSIERVEMDGANNVGDKEAKTTKTIFHIEPCSCRDSLI